MYENRIEDFLQFFEWHGGALNWKYYCLYITCLNERQQQIQLIREHLLCDGILKSYTMRIRHGEVVHLPTVSQSQESNLHYGDRMEYMIHDIGEEKFWRAHMYDSLKDDLEKALYLGCTSFTHLWVILRLFNIKA